MSVVELAACQVFSAQIGCVRKANLVPTLEDVLGLTPGRADELTPITTRSARGHARLS